MKNIQIVIITVLLLSFGSFILQAQEESDQQAYELIKKAEELMRSDSSYNEMTMEVITPDWKRTLQMRSWDDRVNKRSFIHILSPARDKDTTFLKVDKKLWSYLPRAERTIKIPPSMMLQSWMGSDFSNDDLVKESSIVNDYIHKYLGKEKIADLECHKIQLEPKEGAPVTWGKIIIWVAVDPFVPVKYNYFNRRGEMRREMIMSDLKEMDGRLIPVTWTMTNTGKPGHSTVMHLKKIEFNPEISERIFQQQYLRNPR